MKSNKIALLTCGLMSTSIMAASETLDCSGQKFEYMYLLGGISKKIDSELKAESPAFLREFNKAANAKGAAGNKAMDNALNGITCTIYGIREENFLSMTFKSKTDRFGDYQVEFSPTGGYQDWVFSMNNKAPLCWKINVHKGGWYVKAPGSDDNYRIYARTDPKLGTQVVESCR
jgi:hypothetical protein